MPVCDSCCLRRSHCSSRVDRAPRRNLFPRRRFRPRPLQSLEVTAFPFRASLGFRPAIHLRWQASSNDSLGVKEFVIFQKQPQDSSFALLVRSIPGNVFDYYENIDDIGYPQTFSYKTVLFKMVAIDSLGRSGDTAAKDSVVLCWPPYPLAPSEADTLSGDSLIWSVRYVQGGYYTYSLLYSDSSGLVWTETRPIIPTYGAENDTGWFAAAIPSTVFPLVPGGFSWLMKLEVPANNAQSMAVRRLYAQ